MAPRVAGDEKMRIEVIGQRLLIRRQCIAEAAILSARVLHMKTEAYAKKKVCNGFAGRQVSPRCRSCGLYSKSPTASSMR